jgi:hypothetical protein
MSYSRPMQMQWCVQSRGWGYVMTLHGSLLISVLLLMFTSGRIVASSVEADSKPVRSAAVITCVEIAGADLSAKLSSCLEAVPDSGGVVDATRFTGRQSLTSAVMISKSVRVIVGCATWVQSAELRVAADGVAFVAGCNGGSLLQRAPGYIGRLIGYVGPGHAGLEVSGLTFDNGDFRFRNTDASTIVYLHSGNNDSDIHHNRFLNLGTGRAISSGGYSIAQERVRIEDNQFSTVYTPETVPPGGIVRKSGVVTLTATGAHGLGPGVQIYVLGATDPSFDGIFTIMSVPTPNSMTYAQALPNAVASGGTVAATNLRTISLVTPGFDVHVNRNTITGAGAIVLEPSSEPVDGDIEICGNSLQDVDATNILVRTHDNTRVENVSICNNHMRNAGLQMGKGCIAIGENAGNDSSSAVLRNAAVTGNECRGWGNRTGPSIGISVAGATSGSTTEDIVVSDNLLDARRLDGAQTSSGYGIFIRNNTSGFQVTKNRIAYSGRSCVATTYASDGDIAGNTCEYPVRWPDAKNPPPAWEGCYQIDIHTSAVTVTANRCVSPGTANGPSNGFYVADSDTIDDITLKDNVVVTDSQTKRFILQKYAIGAHAGVRSSNEEPRKSIGAIVVGVACTNSACRNSRDRAIKNFH